MRVTISRRKVWGLAVTLLVGGVVQFLTGSVAEVSSAEPASVAMAPAAHREAPAVRHAASTSPSTLAPDAAKVLFALARRAADASRAEELFAPRSWYVAPPPPPPPPPAPAADPVAPPLPYTFVGSYSDGSNATVYFITRDDRIYDVKPGDVLEQIYSFDGVENEQLVFTYKPLNTRQVLPLGAAR